MTKGSEPQDRVDSSHTGVLLAGEEAALQTALRHSRPATHMARALRRALGFEDSYQRVMKQLDEEKAFYDAYRLLPGADVEYREIVRSGQEALQMTYGTINDWMLSELKQGTWLAFAIETPMADVPRHQVLLPQQWQLLSVNGWDGKATGGGRCYEAVRIVDLSVLSADEAKGVRDALIRKTSWPSDGATPARANSRMPPSRQPKRRPPDYSDIVGPAKPRRHGPQPTWHEHRVLMEARREKGPLEATPTEEFRRLIELAVANNFRHRPSLKTLRNNLSKLYWKLMPRKRS